MNKSSCGFLLVLATSTQVTTEARERIIWPAALLQLPLSVSPVSNTQLGSQATGVPPCKRTAHVQLLKGMRRHLISFLSSKQLNCRKQSLKPGFVCCKTYYLNGCIHDHLVKIPTAQKRSTPKEKESPPSWVAKVCRACYSRLLFSAVLKTELRILFSKNETGKCHKMQKEMLFPCSLNGVKETLRL